jgi:hypothetical protein
VHGAAAPQVKAKASVRAEIMNWGLDDVVIDVGPVELILRMITQSVLRQQRYAEELARLIAAAPTLRDALVGDAHGEFGKTGEYIRAWTRMEDAERDRCARWTFQAIAVGVAAKQIDIARQHGQMVGEVLRAVLADPELGLSAEQQAAAPDVFRRVLGLTGPPAVGEHSNSRPLGSR